MSPTAAVQAELEKALGEMKVSHAPVIYIAGYTAGLRFALDALHKSQEDKDARD